MKYPTTVLLLLVWVANSQAALTDLSTNPMVTATTQTVLPNVLFILDDSGSMAWTHMPDDKDDLGSSVTFDYGYYGYRSSQCNSVYYDPALTYEPPQKADGSYYANASFTAAWNDGYDTGGGHREPEHGLPGRDRYSQCTRLLLYVQRCPEVSRAKGLHQHHQYVLSGMP